MGPMFYLVQCEGELLRTFLLANAARRREGVRSSHRPPGDIRSFFRTSDHRRPGGAPWVAGDGFTRRELTGGRTTANWRPSRGPAGYSAYVWGSQYRPLWGLPGLSGAPISPQCGP